MKLPEGIIPFLGEEAKKKRALGEICDWLAERRHVPISAFEDYLESCSACREIVRGAEEKLKLENEAF